MRTVAKMKAARKQHHTDEISCSEVAEPPEVENSEESGWSKRKRVPQKGEDHDALDSCFSGIVLNSLEDEAFQCKQAGCETQWVSTLYYENSVIFRLMFTCLVPSKRCGTCASAPELGLHDLCRFLERTGGETFTQMMSYYYI